MLIALIVAAFILSIIKNIDSKGENIKVLAGR
jgi:hypothetical protein